MNKKVFLLKVFSLALLPLSLLVMAESLGEQEKILPYIEANGDVDAGLFSASLAWVSAEQIVYGSEIEIKASRNNLDQNAVGHDFTSDSAVSFFYLAGKNEHYKLGKFIRYEAGVITILLKELRAKVPPEEKYEIFLKGKLGEEKEETIFLHKKPKRPRKCPADNIDENEYQPIFLKSEHGCVRTPNQKTLDTQWIYFRADGEKIPLNEMPTGSNWTLTHWIDWMQAYLIGDHVTKSASWLGESATSLEILSSDGKLKVIEMGEYGLLHARPTRAGMVAAKNLSDNGLFVAPAGGLRLWRDGKIYKITEGSVLANEVSPDGCKIAYVVQLKKQPLIRGHKAKLRVVDVCKAFGVAADANPF